MSNHNKENENSTRPRSSRHRTVTARVQHTRDAQSAAAQALQLKKRKKAKRRALKQRQNESSLTVERPEDTDGIRELRAALVRTQGERNAAEAANSRPSRRHGPANRSIARPSNMSKVKIDDIRAELNLSGAQNDQKWADLRVCVRRYMDAGLLSIGWKEQDNRRLAKVYDVIEAAHPELERFRGQWATAHLVHNTFSAQKTYKNCKTKEGTYRARTRRTRRSDINHLHADSPDDNVFRGAGPRAPSMCIHLLLLHGSKHLVAFSPNASPSPPANNSPVASRGMFWEGLYAS
ncbi:hypothetical protein B0H14DRAFT_2382164 [Mycena olivaceomarginata]|nr:hypothetical protein B0H14DRAFT_2382164 [Mycena olivaceomarginata]